MAIADPDWESKEGHIAFAWTVNGLSCPTMRSSPSQTQLAITMVWRYGTIFAGSGFPALRAVRAVLAGCRLGLPWPSEETGDENGKSAGFIKDDFAASSLLGWVRFLQRRGGLAGPSLTMEQSPISQSSMDSRPGT
jgi:hypothetical protein